MIITGGDPQFIAFVKARLSEQFLMSDLGPIRYFLGIEFFPLHLRGFICLKRNIFRVFLIGLLLLITRLPRLLWCSIYIFVPLMVSLLTILLIIVTL